MGQAPCWLDTALGHETGRGSWGLKLPPTLETLKSRGQVIPSIGPHQRKRQFCSSRPLCTHTGACTHVHWCTRALACLHAGVLTGTCTQQWQRPLHTEGAHLHPTRSCPLAPPSRHPPSSQPPGGLRLPVREAPSPAPDPPPRPTSRWSQWQPHRGSVLPPGGHLRNQMRLSQRIGGGCGLGCGRLEGLRERNGGPGLGA